MPLSLTKGQHILMNHKSQVPVKYNAITIAVRCSRGRQHAKLGLECQKAKTEVPALSAFNYRRPRGLSNSMSQFADDLDIRDLDPLVLQDLRVLIERMR